MPDYLVFRVENPGEAPKYLAAIEGVMYGPCETKAELVEEVEENYQE